ncbi:response regulator transcription factor [Litoreibacter janthinus]|uniref:Two-component system, OmpR family, response regulator RpaB n=1 Tax=Litoreibacter janthinus TaxID=670154 RepID=A0A1I6GCS9_9RHOB|nr:response regulator transcription factor [Litoreibacter janthinus]SFR40024.1 two-component system, OmpR family, response regulator RpaB [Litoreibacter janthinus]
MIQVLLIDDDVELAELMRDVLTKYSIELTAVHTPNEGFEALENKKFDLVLLDVMLPQLNGLQMCSKIRYSNAAYKDISIIILTARTELTDMVVGLETGADDYVKKPFEPRELVARINAILRRANAPEEATAAQLPVLDAGSVSTRSGLCVEVALEGNILQIETQRAQVRVNGEKLVITSMEFELIAALAQRPGEILNRDDLLDEVHGTSGIYTRSIDALIYRLRTKIREAGASSDFIRTVRGRGYSLVGQVNSLTST